MTEQPNPEVSADAGPDDGPGPEAADATWSTGDPRVDTAVARLDDLDERDLDEHVDVFDTIHGDLAGVLDDADSSSS